MNPDETMELYRFQFTPLREGRHQDPINQAELNAISIHAPA